MLEVAVGSLKTKEGFAAKAWDQQNELLDYDEEDEFEGEYYEYSMDDVEDQWFDEIEQTEWMVTDVAADEQYDDLWEEDENWEQIDQIQTFSGNTLQRKCLHMWGQRLCLCQFLGWLDSRKFQCQAKSNRFYNPMMPQIQKIETKPKKKEIKIKKPIKIKTKPVKPTMSKKTLKKVVNKALEKAVNKQEKKEKKELKRTKKKSLLIPKHIPYRFEPIIIPKKKPKWLPDWMWQEFKLQNEQHKKEKMEHKAVKKEIKQQIKKKKEKKVKEIKKNIKLLKKAKVEAKKEIKKELKKKIAKEKVKAAIKTQKKVTKSAIKAVKAKIEKVKSKKAAA